MEEAMDLVPCLVFGGMLELSLVVLVSVRCTHLA